MHKSGARRTAGMRNSGTGDGAFYKCAVAFVHVAALAILFTGPAALAGDGYRLWLRYDPLDPDLRKSIAPRGLAIIASSSASPVEANAVAELVRGLGGLLQQDVPVGSRITEGGVLVGTPDSLPLLDTLDLPLGNLGEEGFHVGVYEIDGDEVTVVTGNSERGVLYGAFALLRHVQQGLAIDNVDITESPHIAVRVLNHWDNLDRSVERGYAGQSIWDWWRLPGFVDPRYVDYARANASIGINGTVLNNVNANAQILTPRYIEKVRAIADALRPWGIRVYLSARFSAPSEIGGLETADPLDPGVRRWWQDKAAEIYSQIPDFGGFLVKANSEGQPGPQNYGRTHADGANLLADALAPHGGIVMWRAFVYSDTDPEDRVKQAYSEFVPLDGDFADNVLVQVKNGPLDFQPREPFHPMFGAMPETPLMMEFQITQEYLGFSTHVAWLGALWEEVLDADTYARGPGTEVADIVDGSTYGNALTGIAGVANIGSDRDWSGSIFGQANWFAFGRLAWDPRLPSADIAAEWLRMTFSRDPAFVEPAMGMMQASREAVVDYMTPLGLTHIMGTDHHYGPAPWVDDLGRPEWNPYYYHRADSEAIGFDRTESGSNAIGQYATPLRQRFERIESTPEHYLLWFHRLPWDHRLSTGLTLWESLVAHYDRGVAAVEQMRQTWNDLADYVDVRRHQKVADYLNIQLEEARWWRDACLAYFMNVSGRSLPDGAAPPAKSLDYYQSLEFPNAPGN